MNFEKTDPFQGFPNEPWGLKPDRDHQEDEQQPKARVFYHCPVCGKWIDRALTDTLRAACLILAHAFGGQAPTEPVEPRCPEGHGPLKLIGANDRVFVASDQVQVVPIENYQRAMRLEDAALTAWKHLEWMEDRGILTREEMPMLNGLRAIFAPEKVTE